LATAAPATVTPATPKASLSLGTLLAVQLSTALLMGGMLFGYHELVAPKAPVAAPDRVAVAAAAYLAMQPTSLSSVADQIDAGTVKPADVGAAIKAAHTPAASELQAALSAAPSLSAALRDAARSMKGHLK
jgi:hypothetical protein